MKAPITILFLFLVLFATKAKDPVNEENLLYASANTTISNQVSNLNIKAFCQDSLGYMWIATPRGLNRYNGYEYVVYFHDKNDPSSIDNDFIVSLYLDSSHRLWIGTTTGVDRYDFAENRFYHYKSPFKTYVYSFYEDKKGKIWCTTSHGVGYLNMQNQSLEIDNKIANTHISFLWQDASNRLWAAFDKLAYLKNDSWEYIDTPDNKFVECIATDPQGICWLGTNNGIILFDPTTQSFKPAPEAILQNKYISSSYIHFIKEVSPLKFLIGTSSQGLFLYDIIDHNLEHNPPEYTEDLVSEQLISCYVDNQSNIWLGSFDKGFSIINPTQRHFNLNRKLSNTFKDIFVTRIVEDKYHNLFVSTRYDGLYHYAPNGRLTVYNKQNSQLFGNNDILIESLFIDSSDRLWIGLSNEIIIASFTADGRISILSRIAIPYSGLGSAAIREDKEGNIWIGASRGLLLFRKDKPLHRYQHIYGSNSPDVCMLSDGEIIFTAYQKGVFRVNKESYEVEPIKIPEKELVSVISNCINIYEDSKKRIWFGTYGHGVLCITPDGGYHHFSRENGLPSNDVTCILEDALGDIWMSSSYGLVCMKTDLSFSYYFSDDGTLGNQYHEKAGLISSDGRIFFTGNHGLTFFNPLNIQPNKYRPIIHIEDLKISNQSVKPAPKGSVLTQSILFTDKISLNHKHTVVTIDYAGIDFPASHKITYAYKLEGFDTQWNDVGKYRRATYSNLTPGNYAFKVKAFNSDGVESLQPATLQISVRPAPWFSWQAWLLYLLLSAGLVYYFLRLWLKIKMQKQILEIEHNEREREREIAEMKIIFFTNISHELRTPLTLISAPLQQLLSIHPLDSPENKHLMIISRNVQRLLRLMNQLLDFRKMENGMLALKVQFSNIIPMIYTIEENYLFPASEKMIEIRFEPHVSHLEMWIDPDKLEKIMHNLLSNALKHTPSKGIISIHTRVLNTLEVNEKYNDPLLEENEYLEISVHDSGPGIPPDKLNELFMRYRQIDSSKGARPDYAGTGIGLHYTKRLIETHQGQIKAIIPDEGGMIFSFVLPLQDVFSENEKIIQKDFLEAQEILPSLTEIHPEEKRQYPYTVLVAEDNIELMAFLREILSDHYNLVEAVDGAIAWDMAQKTSPDLILSDVLMPEMSGYELCAKVKQHPALSHIPVVLVTAKSTMDDQIEGLEQGADAYICKPFHVDYLMLMVKNLINNRDKLRQYYSTPQIGEVVDIPVRLNQMDQKFMDKLMELLEKELANTELNVDNIAKEMAFSRTSFYRKMRGLTDMSPTDFLRNYRLRRAAEMISEGSFSLYEVAENTGFTTYSYFSVAFKKHFGVTPKDYRDNSR